MRAEIISIKTSAPSGMESVTPIGEIFLSEFLDLK